MSVVDVSGFGGGCFLTPPPGVGSSHVLEMARHALDVRLTALRKSSYLNEVFDS
jgi:hypothetical protein